MLTLLVFLAVFLGLASLGIARFAKKNLIARIGVGIVSFLVAGLVAAFTADFYVVVEPGEVAVYRDLFKGVLYDRVDGPGLHFKLPIIQRARKFATQTQAYTMSVALEEGERYGDDSLQAKTSDGQDVWIDLTVFFHLDQTRIPQLWNDVGEGYVDKIIRPNIRGEGRLVVSGFTAEGLYSAEKRAEAQQRMVDSITPIFAEKGITLERITLRNVNFTPEFSKAVEAKQVEAQNIQRAEYTLQRIEIEKQQKIVEAEGDAEAIRLRGETLKANPQVIQYEFVQKMAPNISWGILPDSAIPLLDLKSLQSGQE